ncbi:hypothetical protein RhiirA4_449672 [Rhizophagus irregularis]|uniref:Uncharacterized protein n=1 Tax=Rhizophagus irregularis TaxID=588596 RepID=A0A2I1HNL7_9GLOM|nr:hypothetical protein RhiirA4_449672 [Rhizophagus irregularis]
MIPEESLDENQIVEQGLIHELCSSISPEDNVSSTEIISSCVSLENLISGSAQHLSYLFKTAIKSSQQEILDCQSKPDHSYFHNKILDQYPNLYKECNSENFDYYGITDETTCGNYICPLCKLGHDDEEIEVGGFGSSGRSIKRACLPGNMSGPILRVKCVFINVSCVTDRVTSTGSLTKTV